MDRETVINLPKKLFKLSVFCKIAKKLYCKGTAIYSMIPKFDKIEGIDTDILIDNCKRSEY